MTKNKLNLKQNVIDISLELYNVRKENPPYLNYDFLFKKFDNACKVLQEHNTKKEKYTAIRQVQLTLMDWKDNPSLAKVSDLPDLIKKLDIAARDE